MGFTTKALIMISMVICLTSVGHALNGQATVYDPPYVPSLCFGTQDRGVMISKAHGGLFANGAACGRKYRVRCLSGTNKAIRNACTGNSVDVTIVGSCTVCGTNELQLSQEAFEKIAHLALGRVNIEYEQI